MLCSCSAYDMEAYVILITIRPLDEDVTRGGPLGPLEKSRVMPAPGFSLPLHRLIFITHTLYHNAIFTYIHSS